jgi:hypothetical protein
MGQEISIEFLIPLALKRLLMDTWLEGDLYKGDLLESVLWATEPFWTSRPELNSELARVAERALDPARRTPRERFSEARNEHVLRRLAEVRGARRTNLPMHRRRHARRP